ncbi:hypothetical protein ACPRNU_20385 [Chromobacterium vaccinii]|uniref:hypothetical protein n=1 Tax=Chromobacterium vaccinii TaxID=1108595 RepID=UPI003C78287C
MEPAPIHNRFPDQARVVANLRYLEGHGLVINQYTQALGEPPAIFNSKITAKGVDFLANDGGLGAILGVQVVKLHDDTLKAILSAHIDRSELPQDEKSGLKAALSALPAVALSKLTELILEKATGQIPDAVSLIRTHIGL